MNHNTNLNWIDANALDVNQDLPFGRYRASHSLELEHRGSSELSDDDGLHVPCSKRGEG